ncbi:thioredoxin family protein [Chryseobacterium sp. ISL-6]|uniref:TlpA family protein disulfide reductase n=1 Tax=Chryseobacterium sp. ISL-6 TaxID=2819143 RepID=UPI001BECC53B|nr:thioredoxin family protein [Chryseobacterium sp. ISL-6]MBT2623667.1 thioredoxin family protein [Chryseobacterium sp. ISL-6]
MDYKKQIFLIFLFLAVAIKNYGQSVNMYFPKFAGKTYDFILFQGHDTKVQKGIIPPDGKFVLEVPKEFSPYKGMSRWLITGTQEGGGLDMIIPGHDFSIECVSAVPDNKNIIYKNNNENGLLDSLYEHQKSIIDKFMAMKMVTNSYTKEDKNFGLYQGELNVQKDKYAQFQRELQKKQDYASSYIPLVNITNGMGSALKDTEDENKKELIRTVTEDIRWDALYTSGNWDGVISMFTELENKTDGGISFAKDFKNIGARISDKMLYTFFAERVTYYLTKAGRDDVMAQLAPAIRSSGKIGSYDGVLSVYQKAVIGSKAPDLMITPTKNSPASSGKVDSSDGKYQKTLLVFYQSGCGHCDTVMNDITTKQDDLIKNNIRLIAISADTDKKVFEKTFAKLNWKGIVSCDLQGMKGSNFVNYGVQATPTLFTMDEKGNILTRGSATSPILNDLLSPSKELWRKIRKPPRPWVSEK